MEASCWYFTKENLENTPSRKCGVEASKELSYRQQAANFIQDMGQRLQVTQLCINTAIVYMHRFYMFHSFTKLHRNQLAVAALFLAAKVEEQPRKLEHVVRVAHKCLHRGEDLDPKSEDFQTKCNELVSQENMMLQTLGFDIAIVHPHTYVVKLLQLVKASKDLAQTSYFMATNSLHLTTMCLQYKPTVVACVCIHLACKWSKWKIEPCSEGKEWYFYVDKSVTPELLEELTRDFLVVLEKSPNRLKRKVGPENNKDGQSSQSKSTEEIAGRVEQMYDVCIEPMKKDMSPTPSTSSMTFVDNFLKIKDEIPDDFLENPYNPAVEPCAQSATLKKPKSEPPHSISLAVYREKQEKKQLLENKALLAITTVPSVTDFPPPPPLTSTVSAPKLIAPEKPVLVAPEKPAVLHQEKRLPHKLLATSSELVPQRMPDKNNHKNLTSSSHLDVVSSEKINHLIPKAMVAPMPQVNQLPPKVSVAQSAVTTHPRNDLPKIAPEVIRNSKDPFVLLTRVDQSQFEKQIPSDTKPGQHITLPLNANSKGNNAPPSTHKSRSRHTKPESVPTNWGKDLVSAESHASVKHKSKMNAVVMQNNHNDVQHSTQGTIPRQSPSWDPTKANGSKVPEQPAAAELSFPLLPETSKPVEKPVEVHNKHERREKHKHKHSVHSSRDRANHVSDSTPDHGMPGGIKITIPKDKLLLSGIRSEGSQKSSSKEENSRTSLKIKIKPPPVPENTPISVAKVNSTGSGLKLVITKDKNAGSYSASRKAASRKRDRSPSSKMHNSRSSGKSGKLPKLDGIANPSLPNPNSAHSNMVKQTDLDVVYNNLAQQPYVIPACNPQPYYPQFCPYPLAQTNVPYGFPPPLPPQSHSINSAPPLPRDPPPPLPPQPPAT